jgi:hypothetical protein
MTDTQHRANDDRPAVPAAHDGGGRDPGPTLGSTAIAEHELERLMGELGDDERVVVELVLECLRAQQAMTSQMLAWLRRRNGTSEPVQATAPEVPDTREPSPSTVPRTSESGGGLISRWRHRARSCAVCSRDAKRTSSRELSNDGWAISGQTGICPDCRSTGWRVSDRGGLPFRRRGSSALQQ